MSSKVVFCTEAPWQCKLDINMSDVVGDRKVLTARCRWNRDNALFQLNVITVMVVLGTLVVHLNDHTL